MPNEIFKMKKIFTLFLISSIVFVLMACTKEEPKEFNSNQEGIEYYKRSEYKEALPLLEKASESGNVMASYYIGEMYRLGKGVSKNDIIACQNYLKSSEGGNKKAFLMTGTCFFLGEGIQKDFKEAFKWFKRASDEIDETTQDLSDKRILAIALTDIYLKGLGTLQDFSEAAKWARRAAELDDTRSQAILAFFLYSGQGILQNRTEAKIWAEKSAGQGDSLGQVIMGMLYQYGEGTDEPDMKKAIDWYEKSAEKGNPIAQYQLATLYENGNGLPKDPEKAKYYYEQSAKSQSEIPVKALAEFKAKQKRQN